MLRLAARAWERGSAHSQPCCTRALSRDVQRAGSAAPILLTQQVCPSVPAPCCLCWLTTPSLRPSLSSHSSLPPCGPAGTRSATWGCWGSRRPPRSGGCTPDQAPRKALLDGRAVLCSILPACPSSPAEHVCLIPAERRMPSFGQGDPRAGAEPLAVFSLRHGPVRGGWCNSAHVLCQAGVSIPRPLSSLHVHCLVAAAVPCAGCGAALGYLSCSHTEVRWWVGT